MTEQESNVTIRIENDRNTETTPISISRDINRAVVSTLALEMTDRILVDLRGHQLPKDVQESVLNSTTIAVDRMLHLSADLQQYLADGQPLETFSHTVANDTALDNTHAVLNGDAQLAGHLVKSALTHYRTPENRPIPGRLDTTPIESGSRVDVVPSTIQGINIITVREGSENTIHFAGSKATQRIIEKATASADVSPESVFDK